MNLDQSLLFMFQVVSQRWWKKTDTILSGMFYLQPNKNTRCNYFLPDLHPCEYRCHSSFTGFVLRHSPAGSVYKRGPWKRVPEGGAERSPGQRWEGRCHQETWWEGGRQAVWTQEVESNRWLQFSLSAFKFSPMNADPLLLPVNVNKPPCIQSRWLFLITAWLFFLIFSCHHLVWANDLMLAVIK